MTNGVMMQYFEWYLPADQSLWRQVAEDAIHLAARGVTGVWLPPAYKGQAGVDDVGYGVYDTYDLGEFDQKGSVGTKYGTKEEYLAAIRALQDAGIQVYADIVLNHRMGADSKEKVAAVETAPNDRTEAISDEKDIEAWTRFTFPGRHGKYSEFIWSARDFDGVDWDERAEKASIYKFAGSDWDQAVDKENKNYDYLMGADVAFSNPEVVEELTCWGEWYVAVTNVDGFRLDAVKHIDFHFFPWWLGYLREKFHREFFAVGEYWSANLEDLKTFMETTRHCMSLFDVPLHFTFHQISHSNGQFDMRHLLDGSLVAAFPDQAVTFVENHDTQAGQALESVVGDWFDPIAYSVILLRPQGYPCLFYGDWYGVPAKGSPGIRDVLEILLEVRKNRVYGTLHDYFDHEDVVGWTLEGDDEHPGSGTAVLITDALGGAKSMYVGTRHAGQTFTNRLAAFASEPSVPAPAPPAGGDEASAEEPPAPPAPPSPREDVVIGDDGFGLFSVGDGSVSVWVPAAAMDAAMKPLPDQKTGRDSGVLLGDEVVFPDTEDDVPGEAPSAPGNDDPATGEAAPEGGTP